MSDPDNLIDENGNALVFSVLGGCSADTQCPMFVWFRKDDPSKGVALLRQWPTDVNGITSAPVLAWNKSGDARDIANWQVLLVDRNTSRVLQTVPNAFVKFDSAFDILFEGWSSQDSLRHEFHKGLKKRNEWND